VEAIIRDTTDHHQKKHLPMLRDETTSPLFREKWNPCVQSMGKGRRKSSVGLMCILEFLKITGLFWSLHNIVAVQEEKRRGAGRNYLMTNGKNTKVFSLCTLLLLNVHPIITKCTFILTKKDCNILLHSITSSPMSPLPSLHLRCPLHLFPLH